MKNYYFLLLLSCFLNISIAQSDYELNEQYKLDLLKEEQKNQQYNNTTEQISVSNNRDPLDDTDDDGMDDDWEIDNGLDPTDPLDAWLDNDGDQVLNLFEFQLNALPNNSNSPRIISFNPGATQDDVKDAVDSAESDPVVLRFAEGTYTYNILAFFNSDYYLMIQGGWNQDFTSYNPDNYETIFTNNTDEIFTLGASGNGVQKSGIVLDGFTIKESGEFILGGGMQLWRHRDQDIDRTSIYNCKFLDNNHFGLGITHKDAEAFSEVFFVKTIFGNNNKGGIYTQVTDGKNARWRFINCTIHNPNSTDGGIDGLTAEESLGSKLAIESINTINYGNDAFSFNFFFDDSVTVNAKYSTIDEAVTTIIIEESNAVNTDPVFENVLASNFILTAASPLVDAGIDIGLLYGGTAPDIGAEELNEPLNIQNINQLDFSLYPSLLKSSQSEIYITDLEKGPYDLAIINIEGKEMYQTKFYSSNNTQAIPISKDLNAGTYYVRLSNDKNEIGTQSIIIIK